MVEKLKVEITANMRDRELIRFLYTYRSLSNAELNEYLDFYSSGDGAWLVNMLNDAYLAAFKICINNYFTKIMEFFKDYKICPLSNRQGKNNSAPNNEQ
ncbi:MAG: hypothetical protein NC923_01845 [Candidatus Omnitrophica bacterium]|nr:hypothetical protein [Candidatus Omnitrophota bacterium]